MEEGLRFFSTELLCNDLKDKYVRVIADVYYGYGTEDREKKRREEVEEYIAQYEYRRLFGLSWREFMDEPYKVYAMNLMIDTIRQQAQNKRIKK